MLALFFGFRLRLRQSSFHWSHKRRRHKRNRKKLEPFWFFRLQFRRAYDSVYDSDFRFSLGRKRSYDSDSVSFASENQPLVIFHYITLAVPTVLCHYVLQTLTCAVVKLSICWFFVIVSKMLQFWSQSYTLKIRKKIAKFNTLQF